MMMMMMMLATRQKEDSWTEEQPLLYVSKLVYRQMLIQSVIAMTARLRLLVVIIDVIRTVDRTR